jgi:hypothetical protein
MALAEERPEEESMWRFVMAGLALGAPSLAFAQEDCADISGGAPIIYGAGGSAQRDLVGKASVVLQNSETPVYAVYKDDAGACSGIDALTGLGPTSISGTAYYWDDEGNRLTCNLPLAGEPVDFASMAVTPLACPLVTDESLVENIIDVTGAVSAINLLVSAASTQQVISAEAAYLVYGFGPEADVAPWNNPDASYYIRRNENSAAQIIVSLGSTLPVTQFFGVDAGSNTNSVAYLAALAEVEQGISFAAADVADANRATVRTLAWQAPGQTAGYWPDSSATAFDKVNVRNGQYALWMPGHFYGLEGDAEGTYLDPNVEILNEYLAGNLLPEGATKTITEVAVDNFNIPPCAMRVWRDGDLSPVYARDPAEPCHCYFDFRATGATTCEVCDDANPCASGACRFGFCEEY